MNPNPKERENRKRPTSLLFLTICKDNGSHAGAEGALREDGEKKKELPNAQPLQKLFETSSKKRREKSRPGRTGMGGRVKPKQGIAGLPCSWELLDIEAPAKLREKEGESVLVLSEEKRRSQCRENLTGQGEKMAPDLSTRLLPSSEAPPHGKKTNPGQKSEPYLAWGGGGLVLNQT